MHGTIDMLETSYISDNKAALQSPPSVCSYQLSLYATITLLEASAWSMCSTSTTHQQLSSKAYPTTLMAMQMQENVQAHW